MGDEIFSVYLTPADYSKLAYAKLDLPASPWKLLDAMDKVRLPEGDSLYLEITDYRDFEVLRSSLVCSATNLLELNDLAERLSRLNEVQRIAFEGLVRVDFQKQESITLKRLRDLAESVDCCHVVESVVSDGQLWGSQSPQRIRVTPTAFTTSFCTAQPLGPAIGFLVRMCRLSV